MTSKEFIELQTHSIHVRDAIFVLATNIQGKDFVLNILPRMQKI
jgi:hypothetical protein